MNPNDVTYDQLVAYALGKATTEVAEAGARRVAADPQAADLVRVFAAASAILKTDDSVAPPAGAVAKAKAIPATEIVRLNRDSRPGVLHRLREIIATLVFDSRSRAALAGVRGASPEYQLSFASELAEVDLGISPSNEIAGARSIVGQVSPVGDGRAEHITLLASGSTVPLQSASVAADGTFRLSVNPGQFDLVVTLSDAAVVLPGVRIQ